MIEAEGKLRNGLYLTAITLYDDRIELRIRMEAGGHSWFSNRRPMDADCDLHLGGHLRHRGTVEMADAHAAQRDGKSNQRFGQAQDGAG